MRNSGFLTGDALRPLILHAMGGLYLDLDVVRYVDILIPRNRTSNMFVRSLFAVFTCISRRRGLVVAYSHSAKRKPGV